MIGYVGKSWHRRGGRWASSMAMAVLAVAGAGPACDAAPDHSPLDASADVGQPDTGIPVGDSADVGQPDTGIPIGDSGHIAYDDGSSHDAGSIPPGPFEPKRAVPPSTVCDAGDTHLYVIHVLAFAVTSAETGQTPGFNLDLHNTIADGNTGCGHMDRRFDIDQNGVVEEEEFGVDNQLVELGSLLDGFLDLQGSVNAGDLLLLVEVSNVENLVNDPCVDVALLLASVPAGSILEHDAEGRLAPGQAFEIDPSSYDEFGSPRMAAKGLIEGGRAYVGPMQLELLFPVEEGQSTWPLDEAQLAFNMAAGHLGVGILGGGLHVDDLLTSVGGLLPDDFPPETVRSFLEPLMDLNPDANNANCDSVSMAFSFAAVGAEEH
jgi:hypothetical protein